MNKWNKLDIKYTSDNERERWHQGITAKEVISGYKFTDKEYTSQREIIDIAVNTYPIANKLKPLAHLKALSRLWKVTQEQLVYDILVCYNSYGRRYTSYRYRFTPGHRFEWLPSTGRKVNTGTLWHAALKTIVLWHKNSGIPYTACIHRELKTLPPTEWLATPLVIKEQAIRPSRKTKSPLLCDSIVTAIDRLKQLTGEEVE